MNAKIIFISMFAAVMVIFLFCLIALVFHRLLCVRLKAMFFSILKKRGEH